MRCGGFYAGEGVDAAFPGALDGEVVVSLWGGEVKNFGDSAGWEIESGCEGGLEGCGVSGVVFDGVWVIVLRLVDVDFVSESYTCDSVRFQRSVGTFCIFQAGVYIEIGLHRYLERHALVPEPLEGVEMTRPKRVVRIASNWTVTFNTHLVFLLIWDDRT